MTPGKVVSILFGIREPTEVILTYKIHDNFFNLKFIQQGVIDISSDDESDDEYVIQSHNYILHDFDNDGVFGWERIMTEAAANDKKNQVLVSCPNINKFLKFPSIFIHYLTFYFLVNFYNILAHSTANCSVCT
jgi:hypothetical protein